MRREKIKNEVFFFGERKNPEKVERRRKTQKTFSRKKKTKKKILREGFPSFRRIVTRYGTTREHEHEQTIAD